MSEAPLPEHSLKSGLTASRAQHVESAVPAPVAVDEKADQGVIRHYEVSFGPASGSKSLASQTPRATPTEAAAASMKRRLSRTPAAPSPLRASLSQN
ncbi:hypothetical protein M8818_005348 [Zalaria obscura]|uniref:Uncharacterized protein n=1 Tax=Zalaria obscura TaxID=2024903 RepID=A0ACC3SAU6_9PEZI